MFVPAPTLKSENFLSSKIVSILLYFLRLISKNVLLYTEMIVSEAIDRGDKNKLLSFNLEEKPVALQLGGSSPRLLGNASKIGEEFGYDEINLNLGCPSKKVQKNRFGACLIKEPNLVADCLSEMQTKTKLPVTVKTRIGYDQVEDYESLYNFIKLLKNIPKSTKTMDVLQCTVSSLASFYDIEFDAESLKKGKYSGEYFIDVSAKILGSIGSIVAAWNRIKNGKDYINADAKLNYADNFLHMLNDKDESSPIVKRIIEDHGGKIKIEKNKNMAGTKSLINFEYNEEIRSP